MREKRPASGGAGRPASGHFILDPAETSGLLSRPTGLPSEMLQANDVLRSEPTIAGLPNHIREQAQPVLLG